MKKFKTRFAPSPTGYLHIGSVKAALLPYLFAKKNNGDFILRIDDTDKQRSKEEYVDSIIEDLKWLNISYDYKIRQSERKHIYDKYFMELLNRNKIYSCYETEEELGDFRKIREIQKKPPIFTIKDKFSKNQNNEYFRFNLNNHEFIVNDLIFGKNVFNRSWSDPIVLRPDGTYTYIFTSIVDDIEEGITHIIRGEEHRANAAIQNAIAFDILNKPCEIIYAHYPLFKDLLDHKVSKRDGGFSVRDMRENNIEVSSIWSLITFLGISNKQIFSTNFQDYINNFSMDNMTKSGQRYSFDLLEKTNVHIMKNISDEEIVKRGVDLNYWYLLKDNVINMEDLKNKINLLKNYDYKNSFYYNIFSKKQSIELFASLHSQDLLTTTLEKNQNAKKECMLNIYKSIFNSRSGPNIYKLIDFIYEEFCFKF